MQKISRKQGQASKKYSKLGSEICSLTYMAMAYDKTLITSLYYMFGEEERIRGVTTVLNSWCIDTDMEGRT